MSKLFSEYTIKDMKLKNRLVMAPMCMDSAVDGYANDWHKIHYATRAIGGVGLIILEATGVTAVGRITDYDLGIWCDSHIDELKKVVESCHKYGAKVGIQISHSGRKSEVLTEDSIAPSAIAFNENYRVPKEMTKEDIKEVVSSFELAAERALKAGFDVIELHGAHGYLISEFLSPISNKRNDEYGGSLENRVRFLKEVIRAVKGVWPKTKPILLRVSADDYLEGGNDAEVMAELLKLVIQEGIDIVDVSTGAVAPAKINTYPGYQVKHSEVIKKRANVATIAGGLITTASMAEEVLSNNRADLVYLGRELLRNPYWAFGAANELGDEIVWPVQYERSKTVRNGGF